MSELYRAYSSNGSECNDTQINWEWIDAEIKNGNRVSLYGPHGTYDGLKAFGILDEVTNKYGDKFCIMVG